ncbi:hypothetical protein FRB91_005095 [Serendipita sp. 411]|nr:hypothetical protein FRB91_005095 [Serendipita sp. 411]
MPETSKKPSTPLERKYGVNLWEFPITLYRVHHQDAKTTRSTEKKWGFRAAAYRDTPQDVDDLRQALEDHLDWSKEAPLSPFISAFSDPVHAFNWARRWRQNNDHEPCTVVEICIKAEDHVTVFSVNDLVNKLDVTVPSHVKPNMYKDEYIFLHRVPKALVVSEEILDDEVARNVGADKCDKLTSAMSKITIM